MNGKIMNSVYKYKRQAHCRHSALVSLPFAPLSLPGLLFLHVIINKELAEEKEVAYHHQLAVPPLARHSAEVEAATACRL